MSEGDAVGLVLEGRYRVEAIIGGAHAGGMVYRGRDATTGATVVIRCPALPERVKGAALDEALAKWAEDAALLGRISEATDDVEKLVAHGLASMPDGEPLPYLVFEWLAGRSLERYLAERGASVLSIGEAIVLLEPAVRALTVAQSMGTSHCDIRPATLWLAEAGGRTRLKVAAFSLGSRIGAADVPFAPEYGAPEHFKKSYGALGPTTDVYGLALCLVEMLASRRPIEGADPTELYLVTSDLSRRPTPRAHGAHVSDALEQVMLRALAVDPKRRYQTVRELWDAVLAAVPELTPAPPDVRPVGAAPLRPMSIPPGATNAAVGSMLPTIPPPAAGSGPQLSVTRLRRLDAARERSKSRKRWIAIAVVAIVILGVAGAKLGTATRRKAARPEPSASIAETASVVMTSAASTPRAPASDEPAVRLRPFLTDMVRVPAGSFTMGSDKGDRNEKPAHKVTLTRAFYIDKTEVTTDAYAACVEEGACTAPHLHTGDNNEGTWGCNTDKANPRHPQNCVDRVQAEKFCTWRGKRLPTEAEWEYAARGADGRDYPWGNEVPNHCDKANVASMPGPCEGKKTVEVGAAADGKSPFGALDMAGNVWEWVDDGMADYAAGDATDPKAPLEKGAKGILRGGSYDYSMQFARTSARYAFPSLSGYAGIGFRCARDATE